MAHLNPVTLTKNYIEELTSHPLFSSLERLALCDDSHGNYGVITVGWDGARRVVGVTLLVTIQDNLITIHQDGTPGFADYLIDQGIPEASITLAFHPPVPVSAQ